MANKVRVEAVNGTNKSRGYFSNSRKWSESNLDWSVANATEAWEDVKGTPSGTNPGTQTSRNSEVNGIQISKNSAVSGINNIKISAVGGINKTRN